MNVLMVTSEAVPFAKAGGLADVVSSLSASLAAEDLSCDVKVVMPLYGSVDKTGLKDTGTVLSVPDGYDEHELRLFEQTLPHTSVPVYFLENSALFGRPGIYGERDTPEYRDNPRRFSVLNRAVFELCRRLEWIPDVLHCHDWPSALAPAYLNSCEKNGAFRETASVFTIHNLGYQGLFSKHDIHYTGLFPEMFRDPDTPYKGILNFLQTGLIHADVLTTVSPTYAAEIQTPEYGFTMDKLLSRRKDDLFGILNGIDYEEWDPEHDPLIPFHFSHQNLTNKKKVKAFLQRKCGLPESETVPLVGMVSRLVEQKGFAELCGPGYGSLERICRDMDIQVVIIGTGERWCEDELNRLREVLPNLHVFLEFNNRMAHLIEAGSDFFLMPSEYEPCGLNQLYSLRYGTLPIVNRTGGLADTVVPYSDQSPVGDATGFHLDELTPEGIYQTVKRVLTLYADNPEQIQQMRVNAMQRRFSWERSAHAYSDLYAKAVERKRE